MPIMCSPLSGCHTDSSQSICSIFRCHTFIKHMWDFSASGICQKPLWHHSSLVILHNFVSLCHVCSSSRFTYHTYQPPPIWQTKSLYVVVLFQFSCLNNFLYSPTGNILQDPGENLIKNLSRILHDFWTFLTWFENLTWFFRQSYMILSRTFKNLTWFLQESYMIPSRILHVSFENLTCFFRESYKTHMFLWGNFMHCRMVLPI